MVHARLLCQCRWDIFLALSGRSHSLNARPLSVVIVAWALLGAAWGKVLAARSLSDVAQRHLYHPLVPVASSEGHLHKGRSVE